jgi:acetyltransferase-like isoleucine patch superfamily enzyme
LHQVLMRLLTRLLERLQLPGTLYTSGKYRYVANAAIFPARNAHLVRFPADVSLHDALFNAWDSIVLEEGVVLGHQVMFLSGRHEVTQRGIEPEAHASGPIHVRRGAWIGSRATILGGVTVGEGAVVGAGSVVTKSVPAHEFWAGNPARFFRPAHI